MPAVLLPLVLAVAPASAAVSTRAVDTWELAALFAAGDWILAAPPLVIDEATADHLVARLGATLADATDEILTTGGVRR